MKHKQIEIFVMLLTVQIAWGADQGDQMVPVGPVLEFPLLKSNTAAQAALEVLKKGCEEYKKWMSEQECIMNAEILKNMQNCIEHNKKMQVTLRNSITRAMLKKNKNKRRSRLL